tara:strand:- start:2322 stop:2597 length:276 start_codon:yes stop_codon:yes gene_type:complete
MAAYEQRPSGRGWFGYGSRGSRQRHAAGSSTLEGDSLTKHLDEVSPHGSVRNIGGSRQIFDSRSTAGESVFDLGLGKNDNFAWSWHKSLLR